ncbi:DsbA family protein [Halosolutus gelatinilyticus]|uniref:DsbA family protein n=1 Tax=Halosolutus gelatinilyticus TaxID=2931975 RepID=UPI001FF61AA6|nr:thioredoxin domain-containing protein [Halosolutus gelatinilyticus]
MNRRSFLALTGAGAIASIAGCTGLFEASLPDQLKEVDPDPDQLPAPSIGAGPVSIDAYSDFACPHCHDFDADVLPELEERMLNPDDATYRHRDFPLPVDDDRSVPMANAGRAVQAETMTDDDPAGAFFEYKRAVAGVDDQSDEGLAALAADEFDVDRDTVADALANDTYYPVIAADWQRGDENGVNETPTVLVDGEAVEDPFDADAIIDAVENAR